MNPASDFLKCLDKFFATGMRSLARNVSRLATLRAPVLRRAFSTNGSDDVTGAWGASFIFSVQESLHTLSSFFPPSPNPPPSSTGPHPSPPNPTRPPSTPHPLLPKLQLGGRIGEHLAELYTAGSKGKNFDKIVSDLAGVAAAVKSGGLVVDRFFATANYSPEECKKVVELLFSAKEPLTSFKDIKDAEVKEVLVDNEGNVEAWLKVRKAIAALGVSEAVVTTIGKLAAEGRLERVKKLANYAQELKNVSSKTMDAVVTSAIPLSKTQQDTVVKSLPAYAGAGSTVNPVFVVDPAILGGITITLQNKAIDLSANSRLVEVVSSPQ